jgi:putative ABC transport system ATP-binding protein
LNTPTAGKYIVDGMDIFSLTQDQRAEFRRQFLGFVFQSFYLVPYLNVLQNVMVPLATTKIKGKAKQAMAEKALKRVGLDQKGHRLPSEISGGEQERVALARAIVNEPPILLADEPTGNLDTKTSLDIMNLFKTLNDDGMTVVMVTHSLECAKYARCTLNLSDGLLVEKNGRTRERTPYADKTTRIQRQAAA